MNVLQVASSLHDWGGIERYVVYLSQGMVERGHTMTVTCPSGSPLDQRLECEKIPISVKRKLSPATAASYLRLFQSRRFDVIHTHFNPDFIMPMWAARMTKQPRLILTRHVAIPWSGQKARLYMRFFDHVIPVSGAVQRVLEASGIPSQKMTVAKAGTPALQSSRDRALVRQGLGIAEKEFAVGSFGRLTEEKGLDVLLAAGRQFGDSARIHIFGRGPLESHLAAEAAKSPELICFHGFTDSVADAMSAMDAIAVTSVWEEAFPYSVLEAMSLGKAIVASRVGGIPEVILDGVTGLLYERSDSAELASQIQRLMSDREESKQIGERAMQLHRSDYTIERMAERIEAVYLDA